VRSYCQCGHGLHVHAAGGGMCSCCACVRFDQPATGGEPGARTHRALSVLHALEVDTFMGTVRDTFIAYTERVGHQPNDIAIVGSLAVWRRLLNGPPPADFYLRFPGWTYSARLDLVMYRGKPVRRYDKEPMGASIAIELGDIL